MPDIGLISSTLSSIQAATEIAKFLKNADSSLEKAELRLQVAELMNTLADSKMNISEIRDLLLRKDEKIIELETIISERKDLVYKEPFYFLESDKETPYCQRCYDSGNKLIRVQKVDHRSGSHLCTVCKTYYGKGKPPKIRMTKI